MKNAYNIRVEYHGAPNGSLDADILAGTTAKDYVGSGYGFGVRDLSFDMPNRKTFLLKMADLLSLIEDGFDLDIKTDIRGIKD